MRFSLVVMAFAFAALTLRGTAFDFYVAPHGDDATDGSLSRPFRTLARARDAARATGKSACRIRLADGTYESDKPLVFMSSDRHLEFVAADGAKPVVSAGRRIENWKTDAKGIWHAVIPKGRRCSQFYVNGQRRTRPFLPRASYYHVERAGGAEPGTDRERFVCMPKDFPAGENPDLEVCLFHVWAMSRSRVVSFDAKSRLITLDIPHFKSSYSGVSSERWYRFDNVRSALGVPGDWYLDAERGEILYVPCEGETPAGVETVVSWHEQAVRFEGSEDITFRGIRFSFSDYSLRANGNYTAQAAWNAPGAVHAEASRGIRLVGCAVSHTGGCGVRFTRGCENCEVKTCELFDLGAGGVAIGDGWEKGRDIVCSSGCVVEDCIIEGGGRVDPAGCGVWIGHAKGNRVAHNTIHDLYYSGISAGWNWDFCLTARDNVLEWNHIYDIGRRVLSDMGGIYLLGRQPGTVERFNHIHDITRARNCAYGIYFDSGTAGVCVSNNVVHDCGDCNWFLARISATNRVENNIFACGPLNQLSCPARDKSSLPSRFVRNIVVWRDGLFMDAQPGPEGVDFADNLYYCEEAQRPKSIRGFTYADPCFRDISKRDFRFADERTARSVGFVPFSIEGCGRVSPRRFTQEGQKVPDVFFEAPGEAEINVAEDFESLPAGDTWKGWSFCPSKASSNLVTVTDKTAAHGRHSLEVRDSIQDWMPHFCLNCGRNSGVQRVSFSLRVERGARPQFEVRDYTFYPVDTPRPTVSVSEGWLCAGGRRLVQVPENTWFRVGLEFPLGRDRVANEYSVRVKLPGDAKPRVFGGLPLGRNFVRVTWLGFTSNASQGQKYWIDDFCLTP